jgi:cytochrome P450
MNTHGIRLDELQSNVLSGHAKFQCARMLLLHIDNPEKARRWLRDEVLPKVPFGRHPDVGLSAGPKHVHIAFAQRGLAKLSAQWPDAAFPQAFRQGMAARADKLGDPKPPTQFPACEQNASGTKACSRSSNGLAWCPTIEKASAVDAIVLIYVQLDRTADAALYGALCSAGAEARSGGTQPFTSGLQALLDAKLHGSFPLDPGNDGVSLVGYQDLHKPLVDPGGGFAAYGVEYFGFKEGVKAPFDQKAAQQDPHNAAWPHFVARSSDPLLDHGSFLVVRQLKQHVDQFWSEMRKAAPPIADHGARSAQSTTRMAEHVMGIGQDGAPLQGSDGRSSCPVQSHITRVNPEPNLGLDRNPGMLRRGMPYVDSHDARGLMFMAIVEDIEQQFEFVQSRWVQRGNHVGATSTDRDPIAGLPTSRGEQPASVFSATVGQEFVVAKLPSFVELCWGDYFFLPARPALEILAGLKQPLSELSASVEPAPGKSIVREALDSADTADAKRALVRGWLDKPQLAAVFWRYVEQAGGLAIEAGTVEGERRWVFVGHPQDALDVMGDDGTKFSVKEYGRRMRATTGEFYLGMDAYTDRYKRETEAESIIPEKPEPVSAAACAAAELFLQTWKVRMELARESEPSEPLRLRVVELLAFVLDRVATRFFGLPGPGAGSLASWGGDTAAHHFRFAADDRDAAKSHQSAVAYRAHVESVILRARQISEGAPVGPEEEPQVRQMQQTLERLARKGTSHEASEDEQARNLLGIVTGSLAATIKLFSTGLLAYARPFMQRDSVVSWPQSSEQSFALYDAVIAQPLTRIRHGGPDSLYRVYVGDERTCRKLPQSSVDSPDVVMKKGDLVIAWLGGGLADNGPDFLFGAGPHECPGKTMAKALIEGVLCALHKRELKVRFANDEVYLELSEEFLNSSEQSKTETLRPRDVPVHPASSEVGVCPREQVACPYRLARTV